MSSHNCRRSPLAPRLNKPYLEADGFCPSRFTVAFRWP